MRGQGQQRLEDEEIRAHFLIYRSDLESIIEIDIGNFTPLVATEPRPTLFLRARLSFFLYFFLNAKIQELAEDCVPGLEKCRMAADKLLSETIGRVSEESDMICSVFVKQNAGFYL